MDFRTASCGESHYRCAEVDVQEIQDEISILLDRFLDQQQLMLQGLEGETDPLYGTGRITDYKQSETDFVHPLWDFLPYTNSVLTQFGMYRSRIMIMTKKVYSWHQDHTPRIHIPIISNPETNFMVVENDVIRMPPDGGVFWVDTTRKHTYVNTSHELRVHIVGCVDG